MTDPVQQKPNTEGWRGSGNYCAEVFMNSNDVIKGSILDTSYDPESILCECTWRSINQNWQG